MQTLTLDLGDQSYPIHIGSGLIDDAAYFKEHIHGREVLVVTNETVAPVYLDAVMAQLEGFEARSLILPDGEQFKTLNTLNLIFDALLQNRFGRKCTLIALGGGVVGDITGFAAASYQRGVNFIQVPTTLLSQVDSSVGGKTGVNHALGKNMIGAFYQPQCVIIDIDTLSTLPDRELKAGLAEVIKYGLIGDSAFLDHLEQNMQELLSGNQQALEYAIHASCKAKADIVAEDEREGGVRALLNLGHTFGHAIETAMGYGAWLHGEAVGTGMCMAADLSHRLGWISEAENARVIRIIQAAGLPNFAPKSISPDRFLELMAVDKKVIDGQLRLILLKGLGKGAIADNVPIAEIRATLDVCRA